MGFETNEPAPGTFDRKLYDFQLTLDILIEAGLGVLEHNIPFTETTPGALIIELDGVHVFVDGSYILMDPSVLTGGPLHEPDIPPTAVREPVPQAEEPIAKAGNTAVRPMVPAPEWAEPEKGWE